MEPTFTEIVSRVLTFVVIEVPNIYTKLSKISQNSVQYKAILLFNKIPSSIRENNNLSVASFKNLISTWCMRERT